MLILAATMLAIGNLFFLLWNYSRRADQAYLTFIGLDSWAVVASPAPVGSALQGGQWNPALVKTKILAHDWFGKPMPIAVVTLSPRQTYGHFLEVIHNLKAQKLCNVLIVEDAQRSELTTSPDEVMIPALVLCGYAVGDAGFSGTLPEDGTLLAYQKARIRAEWARLTQPRTIVDY
jgi:hypothetical protein